MLHYIILGTNYNVPNVTLSDVIQNDSTGKLIK